MRNIALVGKMGSGKDTAGKILVSQYGYTRVAFADPLKELVIEADPIVKYEPAGFGPVPIHLSNVMQRMDFETAKRAYPEVRRSLQRIGQGARRHDPAYWVRIAAAKLAKEEEHAVPVVVTDVRYPNEAEMLKRRGFLLVRIIGDRQDNSSMHESETALDGYVTDYCIVNNRTIGDLTREIAKLI